MKLSIITINYNNAAGLKKTLESVAVQTYTDFEHIIVDGASTDGSVEIIKEYAQKAESQEPRVKSMIWTSEPDTGIYNAMNKGVRKAIGEYVLMLNSGDYLVDEYVLERIIPELDGTDIVQGNIVVGQEDKEIIKCGYGKSDISFIDVMKGHFLHQASFCKNDLFERYGCFDESYRINGDTVFFAKCLGFGNALFRYVDINIAHFDTTGISADPEGELAELRKEEDERYAQMFSKRMWDLFYKEEKKIKLYDKLHAHKWSWYITMGIAKLLK
jgi:glycosyltransferase involved in cell wall biosynthesis